MSGGALGSRLGFRGVEDLGGGRTRVHFRETYEAFNPILRVLLENTLRTSEPEAAAAALAAILRQRPAPTARFLCLSEAVAAPLRDIAEPGSVTFAPRPDESALLDLLNS